MQRRLITTEELEHFLGRTTDFHAGVMAHLEALAPYEEQRFIVAFQSGLLAVEHATGALTLNLQGFHTSACVLMRPQFEAHLLSRVVSGFPAQLVYDVQRNSNAMLALSTQLLSILTGNPSTMTPIRRLHVEFADCLPIIHPQQTANPPH